MSDGDQEDPRRPSADDADGLEARSDSAPGGDGAEGGAGSEGVRSVPEGAAAPGTHRSLRSASAIFGEARLPENWPTRRQLREAERQSQEVEALPTSAPASGAPEQEPTTASSDLATQAISMDAELAQPTQAPPADEQARFEPNADEQAPHEQASSEPASSEPASSEPTDDGPQRSRSTFVVPPAPSAAPSSAAPHPLAIDLPFATAGRDERQAAARAVDDERRRADPFGEGRDDVDWLGRASGPTSTPSSEPVAPVTGPMLPAPSSVARGLPHQAPQSFTDLLRTVPDAGAPVRPFDWDGDGHGVRAGAVGEGASDEGAAATGGTSSPEIPAALPPLGTVPVSLPWLAGGAVGSTVANTVATEPAPSAESASAAEPVAAAEGAPATERAAEAAPATEGAPATEALPPTPTAASPSAEPESATVALPVGSEEPDVTDERDATDVRDVPEASEPPEPSEVATPRSGGSWSLSGEIELEDTLASAPERDAEPEPRPATADTTPAATTTATPAVPAAPAPTTATHTTAAPTTPGAAAPSADVDQSEWDGRETSDTHAIDALFGTGALRSVDDDDYEDDYDAPGTWNGGDGATRMMPVVPGGASSTDGAAAGTGYASAPTGASPSDRPAQGGGGNFVNGGFGRLQAEGRRGKLWLVVGAVVIIVLMLVAVVLFTRSIVGGAVQNSPATPSPSSTPAAVGRTAAPTTVPVARAVFASTPAGPGTVSWRALEGGECLSPFTSAWASSFTVVPCTGAHAAQMTYRGALTEATYPGAAQLAAQMTGLCSASAALDFSAAASYSDVEVQGAYPATQAEWDSGDHYYFCFVSRASGQPLTASVAPTA